MKSKSIYFTELKASLTWHIGWFLTIASFLGIAILFYPGEETMKDFMPLLEEDYFEAFLGSIGGSSPGYTLWIALLFAFISLSVFLYSITTGARIAVQSITDKTGELIHTTPVSRTTFFSVRWLVAMTAITIYFLFQFVLLSLPIMGEVVEFDKLVTVTWMGLFFAIMSLSIGLVLGLLAGNTSKGLQFTILFTLVLYGLHLLGNIQPEVANLNDLNPLAYYQSTNIFLGMSLKDEYLVYMFLFSFILTPLALWEFNRKDLTDDAGVTLNFIRRIKLKNDLNEIEGIWVILFYLIAPFYKFFSILKRSLFPKKIRNSPLVFWGRFFERRFPFAADFIYSDNMTLFIVFLAILMFYPLQLMAYPGDELLETTISGFGNSGMMRVFTYGYDLTQEPPYLWFVISQAIGTSWIFFMPLTFFWVRKAIRLDGDTGTGEILGSVPIRYETIVYQRLLAIFIELTGLVTLCAFWTFLSELVTGASFDQTWEIIAIFASLPYYIFLISASALLAIYFKENGGHLVMLFLFGIFLLFLISALSDSLNVWYVRGIFGLYDPVLIIKEKSLMANNGSLLVLTGMAILSTIALILSASRYTWLNISDKANVPEKLE